MLHEEVSARIIASALSVHSALGAGLLESTYDACLRYEFTHNGLQFQHQTKLPIIYKAIELESAYRIDFVVENCVIVELKAVDKLLPLHLAQMITYLRLSGRQLGLLLNFNVPHMREGIRRVINTR
jgi:GxxExxY protein